MSPSLKVVIDGHSPNKIYTNGSYLTGNINLITDKTISFDTISIELVGMVIKCLNYMSRRSATAHPFLKLSIPQPHCNGLEERVLEAGESHKVPFSFVFPYYLAMGACNHYYSPDSSIVDEHLQLPPTMGFWSEDDFSSPMMQVVYFLHSNVKTIPNKNCSSGIIIMEESVKLPFLPRRSEVPPLFLTDHDKLYKMHTCISIRSLSHIWGTGKLSVYANQPSAIFVSADGFQVAQCKVYIGLNMTTESHVSNGDSFPQINCISAKLISNTRFNAGEMDQLPNLGSMGNTKLPTINHTMPVEFDQIDWKLGKWKHQNCDRGLTNQIEATIALSDDLIRRRRIRLLPTFHSCRVSRTYTLHLTFCIGQFYQTATLLLPVQIGVEIYDDSLQEMSDSDSAIDALPEYVH